MRNKTFWALLASISVCMLLLYKISRPAESLNLIVESKMEDSPANDLNSQRSKNIKNKEEVAAPIIRNLAEELENREKIASMRTEFVKLHALKGSINKHGLRQEVLEKMANDPQVILLAQRVFEDFDWVQTEFQEDQAIVRIYAISLLKMRSLQGDAEPLEQSAQKLAKKLATDSNEWQRGREHDLRDLIGAVIELDGRERILRDVKSFFARVGYEPKLKKVYSKAISSYLYRSWVDEEVDRVFMPFWNETTNEDKA